MTKQIIAEKTKVFVAMSGGVDSSVAAYLIKKQGYEVTGVYMKNWSEESMGGKFSKTCPWRQDLADVKKVCRILRIPIKVYNFEKEYDKQVVDYFFAGEQAGQTPNPDVVCNREIKFGLFLKRALADGADFIATGHYARLQMNLHVIPHPASGHPLRLRRGIKGEVAGNLTKAAYQLLQAKDKNKDQTYFLCLLNQKQLSKSIFPLGNLTKPQVREIAREIKLPVAEKAESMGICFVGEMKISEFLKMRLKETPGLIVNEKGESLGQHRGLPFYTIGQRQGLDLGGGLPHYVIGKNTRSNQLVVAAGAENPALFSKAIRVNQISWIAGSSPKIPLSCKVRIRHRQELQTAQLKRTGKNWTVHFAKKQRAVTPGQYCVFYKNGVLLGGGTIV